MHLCLLDSCSSFNSVWVKLDVLVIDSHLIDLGEKLCGDEFPEEVQSRRVGGNLQLAPENVPD